MANNTTTESIFAQLAGTGSANMFPHIIATMRNVTLPSREQTSIFIRAALSQYAVCWSQEDSVLPALTCCIRRIIYWTLDSKVKDATFMNIHMLLAAILPIIIGSHGALTRPSSASPPIRPASSLAASAKFREDQEDYEDNDEEPAVVTLGIDGAIMAPLFLVITLVSISYLLKWYPGIFKTVMGLYFSILGLYSISKVSIDALNVLCSFIFPAKWHSNGKTYLVDSRLARQLLCECAGRALQVATEKTTPFPGPLSSSKLLAKCNSALWDIRALFTQRLLLDGYVYKCFSFSSYVRLNDAIGWVTGATLIALWNFGGKPWQITNLIGMTAVYTIFQFTSPGKFSTGFLVMSLLLIYDIYMVYFTGLMQKVAMAMEDSPAKLYFPGGSGRGAILGLGDIALPGLMVAFALRFDLYLHYLRKQAVAPDDTSLKDRLRSSAQSTSPGLPVKANHIVKAPYVDATGQWGQRYWNRGATEQDGNYTFPKVYFSAAMTGYLGGFVLTLLICILTDYSVPALMVLCPCVMLSLVITALTRGELREMWAYDETAQDEGPKTNAATTPKTKESGQNRKEKNSHNGPRPIFYISLMTPPRMT